MHALGMLADASGSRFTAIDRSIYDQSSLSPLKVRR